MYQPMPGNPQQPAYAAYPPLPANATYQPHSIYQQPIPVPGAQPVAIPPGPAVVPVAVPPPATPQPVMTPVPAAVPQPMVAVRPAAYPQHAPPDMSPIFVSIPETNVITDQGKPFATYTVQFRMGFVLFLSLSLASLTLLLVTSTTRCSLSRSASPNCVPATIPWLLATTSPVLLSLPRYSPLNACASVAY